MDTKWNGTNELEYFVRPRGRGTAVKAAAGFLAFLLGVSLVLGSLGAIAGQIVWNRDLSPRWTDDWQETENFRSEVSAHLREFLTLGAGGPLTLYSRWDDGYGDAVTEAIIMQSAERGWLFGPWGETAYTTGIEVDSGSKATGGAPADQPDRAADADYQADKNVLYFIRGGEGDDLREYTNAEGGADAFQRQELEGYNFYLTFQNGKVSIVKDGETLDVYGDGVYGGDFQWFVPGYSNFPAGEELDGVVVYMAVRQQPIRYYSRDYRTGAFYYSGSMYYIAQRVRETRRFYAQNAALLGAGTLCLCLCFLLRKEKRLADRKIASWTVHIWTEVRLLAALLLLAWMLFGSRWEALYWAWREMCWAYEQVYIGQALYGLLSFLCSCCPALLSLGWLLWLIHNDHRYNPREGRRSLLGPVLRALRTKDLKRPVEKRVSRIAGLFSAALLLAGAEILFFLILLSCFSCGPLPLWSLWTFFLLPVLLALGVAVRELRRQRAIARDLGRLADQVEAVRAGDLTRPLVLPEDADLRRTAESLNDIQAGMRAALAEQTRSERMKVELVSNVSHDLKTPLTSILSYAELLQQEELPPAAADYARIIDEKAQRLHAMVQDVFEVSKAAADQLPVTLERLDLAKLLRQTLADMDGPIRESGLAFRLDLPADPVMIVADGKRLYRVFQNLLDNALRYALEGSRVYLSLTVGENRARASVRNTSRDELPEGVDFTARFVRGDGSRTDGGSGLGLSIASSFTEACGGSFRVETVADLFTAIVTFPLAEE